MFFKFVILPSSQTVICRIMVFFCYSSITESRLFLVGSSLNGFGTRTSDGDLCLVIKEEPVSNLKHT